MLSIAHGLTGAFIATKLPSPFIFTPLTLASHYIEDWIPHWDVGTGLSSGKRKKQTAIILELFDLAITFGLVYLFWGYGQADLSMFWLACAGAFVGLLPDFMEAPRNFLKWEPAWLKPFNNFHGMFHHSTLNMVVGLAPQVAVVIMVWVLR